MGRFYPLNIRIDQNVLDQQLAQIDPQAWKPYNRSKPHIPRRGLSLYSLDGSADGEIDLNSIREYNVIHGTNYDETSFCTPTPFWHQITAISSHLRGLEPFLCRSHLIEFGCGGHFPPHRDRGKAFRLICFFNCSAENFVVLLDGEKLSFETNCLYFMDTRLSHTLFSMQEKAMILVLNVLPSEESNSWIHGHLKDK